MIEKTGDGEFIVIELTSHACDLVLHLLQSSQLNCYDLFKMLLALRIVITFKSLHFHKTLTHFLAQNHPPHLLQFL